MTSEKKMRKKELSKSTHLIVFNISRSKIIENVIWNPSRFPLRTQWRFIILSYRILYYLKEITYF